MGPTWDMCLCKRGTPFYQTIDIGRVNPIVPQASNGVETLVVREDYENIWLAHLLVPTRCCVFHGFS